MLNSLVSASIDKGDLTYIEKFPHLILTPTEVEFFKWLTEYKSIHGTVPTRERLEESEYDVYLTNHMVTSPLLDLFQLSLNAKREQYSLKRIREITLQIDENKGIVPTQEIIDLGFQLSSLSEDSTIFLSEFNRDDLYSEDEPKAIKFGFDTIDENTGGLQAGEFGLIVARPETGKTLLTNFISWNVATDYGTYKNCKKVLYISAEMTPDRIIARMDAIAGKFNSRIIRSKKDKKLLKEAKVKATKAWELVRLAGGDVIIPNIKQVISPQMVLDLINTHKPDFVVCDAMYRFSIPGMGKDWRADAEIVRQIANIARITNTPILGTTQLSRASEKGNYDLGDISFTDASGQEASIVLAAWNMPSHPNSIIIKTLKARDGVKHGQVEIKVSFNTMTYEELMFVDMESV